MSNPYSLIFGQEPTQLIPRAVQEKDIIDSFNADPSNQMVYMITGVRGAGKTVFMTNIKNQLAKNADWITVELNPERDMLNSLASKLSSEDQLARIFQNAKINLSFFGFGLEVSNTVPITDIDVALEKMLQSLKKKGKKVLICVDEAFSTESMKIFVSSFQVFIRAELPVYLLMTGLYENIHALENEKNLTFLIRAPKIQLQSLNIGVIAENYKKNLKIDDTTALMMAKDTRGYAFAFQVLGYFAYDHTNDIDLVKNSYKQYLDEYVYDKIWSELSPKDKKILYAIAQVPSGRISEIRELLNISTNAFNPYRKRLIQKGLINGDEWGTVKFTLPLFERYIEENYY